MSGAHTNATSPRPERSRRPGRVHGPGRFRTLQRSRVRARSGPLSVTWSPRPGALGICVAYAIPTSVGNAVERNTVRRRLREAVAANAAVIPSGDVLVRVVAPAASCTWSAVCVAVADVGRRLSDHGIVAGGAA